MGFRRLFTATANSLEGAKVVWQEEAFRYEVYTFIPLSILAFFLPISIVEQVILVISLCAILITESLNTAIEAVVDRFGREWNSFSKMAKDLGSFAVFLTVLMAIFSWGTILIYEKVFF